MKADRPMGKTADTGDSSPTKNAALASRHLFHLPPTDAPPSAMGDITNFTRLPTASSDEFLKKFHDRKEKADELDVEQWFFVDSIDEELKEGSFKYPESIVSNRIGLWIRSSLEEKSIYPSLGNQALLTPDTKCVVYFSQNDIDSSFELDDNTESI
jgi:hypothetical protein